MTPFDGAEQRLKTVRVAVRKDTMVRGDVEPERQSVAEEAGHFLRLRGFDLALDAAQRGNRREQSAGHIMRLLGTFVGNGGTWTAEELSKPDPILAKLEEARRALVAAERIWHGKIRAMITEQHERFRAVSRALALPDPGPAEVADMANPLDILAPDEKPPSVAKRYLTVMLEWSDESWESDEGLAAGLEISCQMMSDDRLLGCRGSGQERIEAWAPLIKRVLAKGLRKSAAAEEIIRACARQQGHPESVAKNLIRD